jgi:CIC family chloride channel protein
LRAWQNLPVSAIANFKPVFVEDLSEMTLQMLLQRHPYRSFPVILGGELKGIVTRRELEGALSDHRQLRIEPARTCAPNDSIRDAQRELVESTTGTVVIIGNNDALPLAFLTLHDLLRAQVAKSERERGG